jgi:hypothetical protein
MTLTQSMIAGLGLFSLATLLSTGIFAQDREPCGPDVAGMIAHLEKTYHETTQVLALTPNGALVRFMANLTSGTWSMVVELPDGSGCLMHTGQAWVPVAPGVAT